MNFKITHNWLLDYIETEADPDEIQEYLSLSALNVETIEKVGDDYVYDIEVTSNRVDAASVLGFAQECVAVLPRYGKKASFKRYPLKEYVFEKLGSAENDVGITIEVSNDDTVSRIAAMVFSDIKIAESSDLIRSRLEACGERPVNNVVDISNYIRIALGQPMHIFDYDSIKGAKLSIQKSKAGDKVSLIDGKELTLPGDDIIIKDDSGEIIDLVGHMGAKNTEVTADTKNILVFVPVVNKVLVRRTSMNTGHRTPAISYFEKGLDEERVESAFMYGYELLSQDLGAVQASKLIDIYPKPFAGKKVTADTEQICKLINAEISQDEIVKMLNLLGFDADKVDDHQIKVEVPSYRASDISKQEDIAEEVARMYGYQNIKSDIQKTGLAYQPQDTKILMDTQEKTRNYLSSVGFFEQYNYSMISEGQINALGLDEALHLKISNPLSEDLVYMRTTLIPPLIKNIQNNQDIQSDLKFYELARVYHKKNDSLPDEEERLGLIVQGDFFKAKGCVERLFKVLCVTGISFHQSADVEYLNEGAQSTLKDKNGDHVGYIGCLKDSYSVKFGMKEDVVVCELLLSRLSESIEQYRAYIKPNQFAKIKLDYTYKSTKDLTYGKIIDLSYKHSGLLKNVELLTIYKNRVTLRFTFAALDRNITEAEAGRELDKIVSLL